MKSLLIKVCGLTLTDQIDELGSYVDFIGQIHYPKSPRHIKLEELDKTLIDKAQKVLVTVDLSEEKIISLASLGNFKIIQLHGNESPKVCRSLKRKGLKVIKAFSVSDDFDFTLCSPYQNNVDYFLFDTKGTKPGGNGRTFNWFILEQYHFNTPFFLSGGITSEHLQSIKNLNHTQLIGIDINSGFEIKPGVKDLNSIKKFISDIK